MRTARHLVVLAACGAAVFAAPMGIAVAQQVQAGTLECRGGPDTGFVLGSVTNLNCVLHVDSSPDSRYVAAIQNFEVFIGERDVALNWKVMAPVPWLGIDDLVGTYTHAGDGSNVLVGGANATITLRPLTERNEASAPPANIENLEIRPMDRGS
ncbi:MULTISPECIES: DUF992 domain-containing protein [unclassified Bradyrhizobium]|uniref:DUF992 domain-containing protein n=1 Tax=unclassified Bradyrhizobium TaxID=2631580 RepID=UPI0024784C66|nr:MULTISPECIES: DUF992 domain-containing protein [unclassified Bradyrhizobium]WGS17457.1 DUF992 domain-containing protein [Bradyrhizobium sp. ISRA463]WGS24235.1 DUF992 domain-containing protein [Bradyrhizobium sp. ISRA464]